ncbi:MAG: methyltransferase domain-containing protein [Bacteroidota bacterium]
MSNSYDAYYQIENYFGEAHPSLISFFQEIRPEGRILDLGCGQGRNALPLARLGYEVTGLDTSRVGIGQMMEVATSEDLSIDGRVEDMFEFGTYQDFDFILLDSMLHFTKKDRQKEIDWIMAIFSKIKEGCYVVFCIPEDKRIMHELEVIANSSPFMEKELDMSFEYTFSSQESDFQSVTPYHMLVWRKQVA